MIKRYKGQPLPITISFPTDPTTAYGQTYGDISEIAFNLKIDTAADADDAYLQKLQSDGDITIDQANHKFTVDIASGDYANLTEGWLYTAVLAVQFGGAGDLIELNVDDPKVLILSDENRA